MGAYGEIAKGFTKSKAGQTIIKVTLGALMVAVVLFLIKKLFKNIGEKIEDFVDSQTIRQLVQQTPTMDGSTMQNSFKPQARQIADQSQQAMEFSWGGNWATDEKTLFSSVIDLNGAQLKQVFAEFGERGGMDLFQWYREDLGDGLVLISQATQWGMTEAQIEAHMGANPVNNSSISERQLMANIWAKSGLTTSL